MAKTTFKQTNTLGLEDQIAEKREKLEDFSDTVTKAEKHAKKVEKTLHEIEGVKQSQPTKSVTDLKGQWPYKPKREGFTP